MVRLLGDSYSPATPTACSDQHPHQHTYAHPAALSRRNLQPMCAPVIISTHLLFHLPTPA